MNSLIKSAIIIDKKSDFHNSKVDILIENNIITNIGKNLKNPKNYKEISFNNLHVSKGWFDYSVCFGEPGYEERETILNGIKVASRSGFTSIGLQPNTSPVIEKKTEIEYLNSLTQEKIVNVYPIGALTKKSNVLLIEPNCCSCVGFHLFITIKNCYFITIAQLN